MSTQPIKGERGGPELFRSSRIPVYLQAEASECGLASIAMIARSYGSGVDLSSLRRRFSVSLRGATLTDLVRIAGALELSTRALRLEPATLSKLQLPAILHWDMNHFVVLVSVGRRGVVVHDPAIGRRSLSFAEVGKHFTGIALEVLPTLQFKKAPPPKGFQISSLLSGIRGLGQAVLQILALASALQIVGLVVPFITQWVIDGVIVSGDRDMLTTIAVAYGALIVMQVALTAMRSWSILYIGTQINVHWMLAIFAHLMRLPLSFFEKRHLGDIVSRFQAVVQIQQALSTTFFTAALDGLTGLAALVVMFFYSVPLALAALVTIVLYGGLRALLFAPARAASTESATKWAIQSSHFLESMRNIQTLRLYGMEEQRKARWLSFLIEAVNRDVVVQRLAIVGSAANVGLFNIERLAILVVGTNIVLNHGFSIGMFVALLAYNELLLQRIPSLVDNAYAMKMLEVPADRVADIALTDAEPLHDGGAVAIASPVALRVENVFFRFSESDDFVLRDLTFSVEPGSHTAIAGPSGSGKTTLAKVLLGLLEPEEGRVMVNGTDVRRQRLAFRNIIGTVMQDDKLFAGSIAENISSFDEPDQARIEEAARLASIHEDVMKMPMGYQTLVGDMGSAFSGGQRQRLLLARALYRRPALLILDEATSALDDANEKSVSDAVSQLGITRIIIAHRAETLARADRVIEIRAGSVFKDTLRESA